MREKALTNLFGSCGRVLGTGEQRFERVERGSEPKIFETTLKSMARNDETGRNAMSETDEAAERRTLAPRAYNLLNGSFCSNSGVSLELCW